VALAWAEPQTRSLRRSVVIGCALGALQGVRFGGAVFAGAAVLLVDAGALHRVRWPAAGVRLWVKSLAVIAAAAAATEVVWVIWAFSTLEAPLAVDTLWPLYILPTYNYWVTPGLRWLAWEGWRMMIAQYVLPLAAGVAGAVAFGRWLMARAGRAPHPNHREADGDRYGGAVFIPLCFFGLAFFFFFREVHHFRQFMWTLVPPAAWELERRTIAIRAGVFALWTPGIAVFLKAVLVPVAIAPFVALGLPSGGIIYAEPGMASRIQYLQEFVATEGRGVSVLFTNCASGWFYAYGVPHETRHTWVWAPELIRPYEEHRLIASLDRTGALIDCDAVGSGHRSSGDRSSGDRSFSDAAIRLYPAAVANAIRGRITPWSSAHGCRVYHVAPPPFPAR
jgi:hypothetical protein